jgi:heavy metal sensor kinase
MRLPIRLRLTIAFAVVMGLLLAAGGAFLYARLGAELLRTTDAALRAQADVVAAGISQGGGNFGDQTGHPTAGVETFAQVISSSGQIVESSETVAAAPLVGAAELASVNGPTFLERNVRGTEGTIRLLVIPTVESGERLFVVVGSSLQGRHEVLSRFLLLLLIGGPLALALASAAGWALAGAALRPVDRMGEEAEAMSVSERDRRLPVPETGDEIARLGARLNSMLDRLHVAFDRERQFVDDASHELHTPLTILKTELDLALSRPRTPQELESALRSASEETDRLAALAEDLLLYARAEGARVPVHRTDVGLEDLLQRAVSVHARRAAAAGVSIEVEALEGTVFVDAARVRQAVDNLMTNALRHTTAGGRIQVRTVREVSGVRLVFDDTGSGFPPDFIGRAFEPFARAASERAGERNGAGLGLAIVRAVAEAHGGYAIAENRPEGGARVTVFLRIEDGVQPHSPASSRLLIPD